jgi:hypothetical protein
VLAVTFRPSDSIAMQIAWPQFQSEMILSLSDEVPQKKKGANVSAFQPKRTNDW